MKAKLVITPKKAVLDPQGKTVANALEHMGYAGVTGVRVGKYIEIDLAPGTSAAAAVSPCRAGGWNGGAAPPAPPCPAPRVARGQHKLH
jgi:phosphoribosylformylglycinamidine synthase